MRFGIDLLIDSGFAALRGRRVGLFTNLAAVNRDLVPTYDVLRTAEPVHLVALFSPEHGLDATVAEGVAVDSTRDPRTGLPVYSLYGASYRPAPEMLEGLDVVVCDIQDIGVRYYTHLWVVTHILEACGEAGVPVLILDRPNPLGDGIDGGGLDPELVSLVGRYPIPVLHGMTLGELARMANAIWNPTPAEVDVVPCDGWRRTQPWDQIGRPFVPPSPNMPHFVTARHYAGSCLIEGTTLSEGRGTPLPFEVVGAPYIDAWVLAEVVNDLGLDGVRARPLYFTPDANKHAGHLCGGIHLHIMDERAYRPLTAWLAIVRAVRHLYPDAFTWLPPHAPGASQHLDRLLGDTETRRLVDRGATVEAMTAGWDDVKRGFEAARQPYLLYQA